jgi:N-acetylneuraminic acid mutarotase
MIIWGGAGITGGRYSPSTDSWIPTSTEADVPLSRNSHTAVWTGTEMIIWGGFVSYQGDSNSGGRYDPELDLWAPTSAGSNVPSPREGHTAVWTGKEMIVWGGLWMFNGISNTGGKYDPSTDSWIPTSMGTSAPSSRWCHTAVWTGTEMIIWGGFYGTDSIFNNGARYEPSTDSWISTSSGPNVPSHRRDHTAIWTGTEMIVWGGVTGHDPLGTNTGGRYTPSTDSWNSTSIAANAPAGRWWHTAIWTGSEMIVWGGYADGFLISGGIYRPNSSHERPVGKPE